MMHAVRFHSYGPSSVLSYEEAPRPELHDGTVLIRVYATSVNPTDSKIHMGFLKDVLPYPLPHILGQDVSGVIEAIGSGVSNVTVGDAVYTLTPMQEQGAYAEYVVVPAVLVAHKPQSLDYLEAAAVPMVALTAWQALFDHANLSAGQTILIHAAAGGVGHFAVQFAKWKGAKVIGTASASNTDFLHSLGADEVIDYRATAFETVVRDVDIVLDSLGGEIQERSWNVLKRNGILVSLLGPIPPAIGEAHGVHGIGFLVQPNASQLITIADLINQKLVKPVIEQVLPLTSARIAHETIQSGHTRGKISLRVKEQ